MANNSLLDVEVARRYLEQLEEERRGLADLIRNLKHIRETMVSLKAEIENNKESTQGWLTQIEADAKELNRQVAETSGRFSATIQSFEQRSQSILRELSELPNKIQTQMNQAEHGLKNVITGKMTSIEERFESFRDEHFKSLDQVSKAYERMRISYDTMRDIAQTLEADIEGAQREFSKQIGEINERHASSTASLNKKIGQAQETLNVKMDELITRLSKYEQTLDEVSVQFGRTTRLIWIISLISLLLGGASLILILLRVV